MHTSFALRLRYTLTATVVTVLVLLAVAFTSVRVLVAYAPAFRSTVEAVLGEMLGQPLTLGGLRAQWKGRNPSLILEGVRLQDAAVGRSQVVDELRVELDLLGSLREMRLKPAEIGVTGLTVTVRREPDGGWRVRKIGDLELGEIDAGDSPLPELPAELHLSGGVLLIEDALHNRRHRFSTLDLRLAHAHGRYALAGYVGMPHELGRHARFRIELDGLPGGGASPGGLVYLEVEGLNLANAGNLLGPIAGAPALAGAVDGRVWLEVAEGRLQAVSAQVKAERLRVRPAPESDWRSVAAHLSGRFRWQRESPSGWTLAANEVVFVSDYRVWPRSDLLVRYAELDGQAELQLRLPFLRLEDVAPTLAVLPQLPAELTEQLARAQPRGELQGTELIARWSDAGVRGYQLRTRFVELGLQPLGDVPGGQGLSGWLLADQDGGRVELNGGQGRLEFAGLFREALPFRALRGEVVWRRDDDGLRVEAPRVEIDAEDGLLLAQGRVFLDGDDAPFLDLRAHLSNGNGQSTSRYLPVGIMVPELVAWLDGAIRGGRVPSADFVLYGRAQDFPYDTGGKGVFEVRADVVDARLDYMPGWPALEQVAGVLRFDRASMDISARAGRIFGAQVQEARVWMDDLVNGDLQIEGKVRGSGGDMLRFLKESPLGSSIRRELAMVSLSGVHDLSLRVTVPLYDDRAPKVKGAVSLRGGSLAVPRFGVGVDALQGVVQFTERGVSADGVRGRFRGRPLTVGAVTEGPPGKGRIKVSAPLHASLGELLETAEPPGVSGSADWLIELLFPAFDNVDAGDAGVTAQVSSDLEGIAVNLPEPLAKPAGQRRPLRLRIGFDGEGMGPVAVSLGGSMRALLEFDDTGRQLTRASVQVGGGPAELKDFLGISITGQLERLDLDAWRKVDFGSAAAAADADAAPPLPLEWIDLEVGSLRALGLRFRDTRLQLRRGTAEWLVNLAGPDLAGRLTLPDAEHATLRVELDRLRLLPGESAAPAAQDGIGMEIPLLDLRVAELLYGPRRLGSLRVSIVPDAEGMRIERAELKGPVMEANASGGWSGGGAPTSRLRLQVASVNAGEALTAFGYAETIRGGVADATLELSWPGKPADFDLNRIAGALDMTITNGQMLSVEPGAGRLFGLLSVTALPRRLALDFSDLFDEGFAFDRIEAHFDLRDGNAHTRKFFMQGPAARVELEGRIGLSARDYDQLVTVMPHISSALPAVGAVAGGPVGAAALLVTQKLLEKQLNKLIRVRYRVQGSWEQPDIAPVDVQPKEQAEEDAPS